MDPHSPTSKQSKEVQLRDALLSAMNHDLRSPLGAISIFCEILTMSKEKLDEQQQQNLAMIMEATAKALRIVDDASELGRIYKGTTTLQNQNVELGALLNDVIHSYHPILDKKGVSFSSALKGEFTALADLEKLRDVMVRLLEEAMVCAPTGGELQITPKREAAMVQMKISLLSGSDATKAQPLSSVKGRLGNRSPTTSPYSLAACALLVEQMGGQLQVDYEPQFSATLSLRSHPL